MRSKCIAAIMLSAAMLAAGCHQRIRIATIPPVTPPPITPRSVPPPVTPSTEPVPTVVAPPPTVSPLEEANSAFTSGNFDEAARRYENILRSTPSGPPREQALFYLALIYASRPAPATDWQHATNSFKQLIEEYPNSPFKGPATLILSLRAQVDQAATDAKQREQRMKQLTTELDRLKKIDADRRKRP